MFTHREQLKIQTIDSVRFVFFGSNRYDATAAIIQLFSNAFVSTLRKPKR